MLAFDWRERLQSAADVIATLDGRVALPAATPPAVPRPAVAEANGAPSRSSRRLVLGLLAVVAVLAGIVLTQLRRAPPMAVAAAAKPEVSEPGPESQTYVDRLFGPRQILPPRCGSDLRVEFEAGTANITRNGDYSLQRAIGWSRNCRPERITIFGVAALLSASDESDPDTARIRLIEASLSKGGVDGSAIRTWSAANLSSLNGEDKSFLKGNIALHFTYGKTTGSSAVASVAPVAPLPSAACDSPIRVAFPRDGSISVGFEPLIVGALRRVELCHPQSVTVTGKAGPDEETPAVLAFRRATKIADALRRAGVPAALIRTRTEVAEPSGSDAFQNKVVEIAFVK